MKISIITCHRAINYGAVLQAFALSSYLKQKNNDVEIIDYNPKKRNLSHYSFLKKLVRHIIRFPDSFFGKLKFNKFLKDYLLITKKEYTNYSELVVDPPISDCYITGSDQIWNFQIHGGCDPAYFLAFAPSSAIKASYAASIAQDELPEPYPFIFADYLKAFNYISTREETAKILLNNIGINAENVIDPVFLLRRNEWQAFSVVPKSSGYILVYAFLCTKEIEVYAQELKKRTGKKVYVINTLIDDYLIKADKHFWLISPTHFVGLFANADYVVTNSFHGLAFSILFEKQVYVFPKKSSGNSRLFDFMKTLSIADCRHNEELDYEIINKKLNELRENSYLYLKKLLHD